MATQTIEIPDGMRRRFDELAETCGVEFVKLDEEYGSTDLVEVDPETLLGMLEAPDADTSDRDFRGC